MMRSLVCMLCLLGAAAVSDDTALLQSSLKTESPMIEEADQDEAELNALFGEDEAEEEAQDEAVEEEEEEDEEEAEVEEEAVEEVQVDEEKPTTHKKHHKGKHQKGAKGKNLHGKGKRARLNNKGSRTAFSPAFDLIDKDGNHRISSAELSDSGGLSDEKSIKYFTMYDTNLDGKISKSEFSRYPGATFNLIDHDSSNTLSEAEIMEFTNVNRGRANDYIDVNDKNGDKLLDLNEFTVAGLPDSEHMFHEKGHISANPHFPSPVFDLFDLDGSGMLEEREVNDAGNFDRPGLARFLKAYDTNDDGELSVKEFDRVKDISFQLLDLDKNNVLTAFEMEEAANFKKEKARKYIESYDSDMNGKITLSEFNKEGMTLEEKSGKKAAGTGKGKKRRAEKAAAAANHVASAVTRFMQSYMDSRSESQENGPIA